MSHIARAYMPPFVTMEGLKSNNQVAAVMMYVVTNSAWRIRTSTWDATYAPSYAMWCLGSRPDCRPTSGESATLWISIHTNVT